MKAIFFEWTDVEELLSSQKGIDWPIDVIFSSNKFNLSEARDFDTISIFVDSTITDQDLSILALAGCGRILIRAAGFNMLSVSKAKELGIAVYRVASYSPESIAELVFALILHLSRKLDTAKIKLGITRNSEMLGNIISGKSIGLYGYGKIARKVATIAQGFGMKILAYDPLISDFTNAQKVDNLIDLVQADILSIHVPLLAETRGVINKELLVKAKPGLIIINTARGGVLNNPDVIAAMNNGIVGALGVDVWGEHDQYETVLDRENVFATYHIGYYTNAAIESILSQTYDSLNNKPSMENVIN